MLIGDRTAFSRCSPEEILVMMTDIEKGALLGGKSFWYTTDIDRLGIPSVKFSDGPNGLRGASHFKSSPATCIPCATALASTWSVPLMEEVGGLLSRETISKSSSLLLAPTVNIQRSPLGGRSFECFSEDPFLSGKIASGYIRGLQDGGIGAVIKHFVGNDQEHERRAANSAMSERALREIYLTPFLIAQREAQPWCIMTSYNRVDNLHVSHNKRLLTGVLRDEWKYEGMVVSDWFGTNSCGEAIKAGQDLEMPGPTRWRGDLIPYSLTAGTVEPKDLDICALRVLRLLKKCAHAHPEIIERGTEIVRNDESDCKLNRRVASEGICLLKNKEDLLPLDPRQLRKVALIGPNMKARVFSGGGSAHLSPAYFVRPFEGLKEALGEQVEVTYHQGGYAHRFLPLMNGLLRVGADPASAEGWTIDWFNDLEGNLKVGEDSLRDTQIFFRESLPQQLNQNRFFVRLRGYFTPEESGIYSFSLCLVGRAKLFINGSLVVDLWDQPQHHGPAMYGLGCQEVIGDIDLKAGVPTEIFIQYSSDAPRRPGPLPKQVFLLLGGVRLGGLKKVVDQSAEIEAACQSARDADVAIVCVGTSGEWESEASDRSTIRLPGNCDELVKAVACAQPRTIVINQSGSAVAMPWIDHVNSVLQCFFSGNETGNALADVILGKVNPSGKLPITFPVRDCDVPAYRNMKPEGNGSILYSEGLFVGYKWYVDRQIKPLFPFGHGLSYTKFRYSNLTIAMPTVSLLEGDRVTVTIEVTNCGERSGKESVQIYVSPLESTFIRPLAELKGFSKVDIKAGGSKNVTVELDKWSFAFYDDFVNSWRIEPGEFIIHAASNAEQFHCSEKVLLGPEHAGIWAGSE